MIVCLEGNIVRKELNGVWLKTNGVTYNVFTSLNTLSEISENEIYELFIVEIIKEDSHNMYGFLEEEESKLFSLLLSVNGVGPKSAIAICSTYSFSEFSIIIEEGDLNKIKKIPGIGPKSGKQLLLSLSGKLVLEEPKENENIKKAIEALEGLGFKKTEIKEALKDETETELSELIKIGLKKLKSF